MAEPAAVSAPAALATPFVPAPRPTDLDGRALGVLDTGDEDSCRFLDLLVARLEKRHFLSAVVRISKPSDQQPCPIPLLQQLAEECDVVVTGVCATVDSAECASLDAVSLERLLVPCAVVVTAETRGRLEVRGYDDSTSIELPRNPHADTDDVQALVEGSFREIERVLTVARGPGQQRQPGAISPHGGEVTCEC
ncbi:MAG: hypothetical protein M3500_02380 [Actinomycetota bacterium]|nr:hypothetical protein [Actinomycetota bacterium]